MWWKVYNVDQLRRAETRLRQSWRTRREVSFTSDGHKMWSLIPDWFASNRVESRRIRQSAINRAARAKNPKRGEE